MAGAVRNLQTASQILLSDSIGEALRPNVSCEFSSVCKNHPFLNWSYFTEHHSLKSSFSFELHAEASSDLLPFSLLRKAFFAKVQVFSIRVTVYSFRPIRTAVVRGPRGRPDCSSSGRSLPGSVDTPPDSKASFHRQPCGSTGSIKRCSSQ